MNRLPLPFLDKKGQRAANSVGHPEISSLRRVHSHETHTHFDFFGVGILMHRFKPYMYVPQPFQKKNLKKKGGRFQAVLVAPWVQHSVLGNQTHTHYHMWHKSVAVSNNVFNDWFPISIRRLRDDFQNIGRCHVGMWSGSIHSVPTDPNGLDSSIVMQELDKLWPEIFPEEELGLLQKASLRAAFKMCQEITQPSVAMSAPASAPQLQMRCPVQVPGQRAFHPSWMLR